MTRQDSRPRVQPPNHVTRHSPKWEPMVTGVRRRRNLVSSCMVVTTSGQHSHRSARGQSSLESGTCVPAGKTPRGNAALILLAPDAVFFEVGTDHFLDVFKSAAGNRPAKWIATRNHFHHCSEAEGHGELGATFHCRTSASGLTSRDVATAR
jgi:hypothetical protein